MGSHLFPAFFHHLRSRSYMHIWLFSLEFKIATHSQIDRHVKKLITLHELFKTCGRE